MTTNSVHRRRGASGAGVIGVVALVGAVVCVCLGMQAQRDMAQRPDRADTPLPRTASAAPAVRTMPIDRILVGQRVLAGNPRMTPGQLDRIDEIVPGQWGKVTLEMSKADGGRLDIVLLRPTSWLLAAGARVLGEIHLDMPELGVVGSARVVSIQPCPQILPSAGRVVTGTFAHRSGDVVDLALKGRPAPIGTTAAHPFWSEDRREFIPAGTLREGELLRTLDGYAHVVSIVPRAGPEPVYNMEVHGEHVYHVSAAGVLVHNACPGDQKRVTDQGNIKSYNEKQKDLQDAGLSKKYEAHKLVEKRHGIGKYQDSPAVALKKGHGGHQDITNVLRKSLPYGTRYSDEAVRESLEKNYQRTDWLDAIREWIEASRNSS